MAKEMLINASEGEECRIAVLEDGKLEELYMERTSSTSHVGNIYKGRVTNVEPSIQACFVDFGLGRNGFLHIQDLMPTYFGRRGDDAAEAVGRKMSRRDRPPIQRCMRRGDDIVVQIIKEGIGTKGPTLSTYLSIPGRILVMMPGMSKFGVSRKIEDEEERRRLRKILDSLEPVDDCGFIIRTAGIGKNKTEIERDLKYLTRLWENIKKKQAEPAPVELYTEGDLVTRTVRDVFTTDIDRIVVDSKDVTRRIKEFFKIAMPRTKNKVELHADPIPLFHKYKIEKEIEMMYSRHVPLPSGGSLVIDSTEAIVAIDVNSGKFREHQDAETTALKTDLEAADEIPRQLRLRDLGGVIICDFIDLRFEKSRRELEKRLHDNLKKDRAKTKVLRMSQFGIIEMTRQRMRPSLKRSIYTDCPHCRGAGLVKTPESMSLDMIRRLTIAAHDSRVERVELTISPSVGEYLLNKKRSVLVQLESQVRKRVIVRQDAAMALDEVRLQLFDAREGQIVIPELGMTVALPQEEVRHGRDRSGRGRRGRGGGDRHDRHDRNDRRHRDSGQSREPEALEDERHDMESAVEAVDSREETRIDDAITSIEPAPLSEIADAPEPIEPDSDEAPVEPESDVVDIEDGHEPMGDAPRGFEEQHRDQEGGHRHRRRRGRRGRGRGGQDYSNNRNGGGGAPPARAHQARQGEKEQFPAYDESMPEEKPGSFPRDGNSPPPHEDDRPEVGNEVWRHAEPEEDDEQPIYENPEDPTPAPGNELVPIHRPSRRDDDDKKRRRRGGRRHRERRERAQQRTGGGRSEHRNDQRNDQRRERSSQQQRQDNRRVPPRRPRDDGGSHPKQGGHQSQQSPPKRQPPPIVRTGSTDSHLMKSDTPVDPEPPRRPRSHRDLDAIPDDFD